MKNTLGDLNNHLFMALERLNNEDINGEELDKEIRRSEAVTRVAANIIDNAELVLKAEIAKSSSLNMNSQAPKMLSGGN